MVRIEKPDFDRLRADIDRAEREWNVNNLAKMRAILKCVASIAYARSVERSEHDPVAELA
jgi:hypothetical protein